MLRSRMAQALPGASLARFLPAPPRGRTLVLGAGKAGGAMAAALESTWPADAPMRGLVVTRYDCVPPAFAAAQARGATRIEVVEAAHPVPDDAGCLPESGGYFFTDGRVELGPSR